MTNSPIKVGVIGLGNMGKFHVKHWKEIAGTTLVAVVDVDSSRRAEYAIDSIRGFESINAMIDARTVDAVSITSPTSLHFEHARQCIENGIHVLIEKPIATTPEDGAQLVELAKRYNVVLQVGHIERFNPAVIKLLEWKSSGLLGAPISISTERVSPMPTQIRDANVMIDLAVHDIDIVTTIMGTPPTHVTGAFTSAQLEDRADSAMVTLQFPAGIAAVSVGWNSPIKRRTLVGYFQNGLVELDFINQSATFTPINVTIERQFFKPTSPIFPLVLEQTAFLSSIQNGTPITVTGEDGILALKLTLQATLK